jgi:hypothetical protein
MEIVASYFAAADAYEPAIMQRRTDPDHRGDPLFAVWARVRG